METLRKTLALVLVLSASVFVAGCGRDTETTVESNESAEPDNAETGFKDIQGRFDDFEE